MTDMTTNPNGEILPTAATAAAPMGQDRLSGTGLSLRSALPVPQLVRLVRELDEIPGTSLWMPEFALRDAIGQMAFVAAHTDQLRLATGVVPLAARAPAATALAAATVDDVSDGRFVLGLGVGHQKMNESWYGQRHASMLTWAEEYVTIVRSALRGEKTATDGVEVSSEGFRLLVGGPRDVPVVLAALGPRMLHLGAQAADGILLNWTTPEHAARSIEIVEDAAAAASRPAPAVGSYVRVAAGPDAAAHALATAEFYTSLPAYARSLERMGFSAGPRLAQDAADALILTGSVSAVADRLAEWVEAGVDPLVVYPVGEDDAASAAVNFAVEVISRMQR